MGSVAPLHTGVKFGSGNSGAGSIRQQIAVSSSAAAGSGHVEEGMSSDARPSVLVHLTEELLEEYSFGRIYEPQLGWLEEHLLICPQCQLELDDIAEYKALMKAGLAALEREKQAAAGPLDLAAGADRRTLPAPVRPWSSPRKAISLHSAFRGRLMSKNLLAAAFLLVLAGATVFWRMQPVAMAPTATVKLIALRGGEGGLARAPSGRPLELVFNQGDLATDISYKAEVVNSAGFQMWAGSVRSADQSLSIRVDRPLPAGAYWVRLYTSWGQLLREFGLSVS
jgi:hypothetical protein